MIQKTNQKKIQAQKKKKTKKIGININEKNEESKINILKNEEGLIPQKKNRIPKVQFKEKNVRYYSPGQGVNETVDENFKINKKEIDDSSLENKDLTEYKTSLNNKKKKMKYNSNEKNSENSISVEINGIGKMNNISFIIINIK